MNPALRNAFLSVALTLAAVLHAAESRAPNVIVILADELGYGDVGFNGSNSIPTPNLNRIAAGGVVCASAYVPSQVSSPNRAGLLTGRHPSRFGFERSVGWRPQDPAAGLPASEKTLAEALRPLGYQSGLVGKWHLGAHDDFHPLNRGFDSFFGYLGGAHRSLPEELDIQHTREARFEPDSYQTWILRDREPVRIRRHLTEELGAAALDFVRDHAEKPFFLFLSCNAPRQPLQVPEEELAAFGAIKDERRRAYAAMISMMDRGVGRLLDLLDSLELADDTLLFFTSSIGGDTPATGAYNGVARGVRGEPYEGGIRVPFVVRWPRVLPAGTSYKKPVSLLDVFATAAAACKIPADPARPLDGVDLAPFLRGETDEPPHERLFLRLFDTGTFVVREGDHKLVKTKSNPEPQLYDLAHDPLEKTNLAPGKPDLARALRASFDAWNAGMIEPVVPGINPADWSKGRR